MTSSTPAISTTAASSTTANIIDHPANSTPANDDDDDSPSISSSSSSASASSPPNPPTPQFPYFNDLPAELRHQIWQHAIPTPGSGINFFNVHAFPNDHSGCNRSTSPPWVYLDLRRLSIEDDDDEVSSYDPSSFQACSAVRASCREAWMICAIPASKSAIITLTRPRGGLCVRAGDGQLRSETPFDPSQLSSSNDNNTQNAPAPIPVPLVRRRIEVHIEDILCLSIENCSFNLPREESPNESELATEGWAFDPQLMPPLPLSIPIAHICIGMAQCKPRVLRTLGHTLYDLVLSHLPDSLRRKGILESGYLRRFNLYFEGLYSEEHSDDIAAVLARDHPDPGRRTGVMVVVVVVWDRFGECYVRVPWKTSRDPTVPPHTHRFIKVSPDKTDLRERYLRSAVLQSPKRPARSS